MSKHRLVTANPHTDGGNRYALEVFARDGEWRRYDSGTVDHIADVLRHGIASARMAATEQAEKADEFESMLDDLIYTEGLAPNVQVLARFIKRGAADDFANRARRHDGEYNGRPVMVVERDCFWDVELLDLVPLGEPA